MTALNLCLMVVQAALLLWACVHFSNVFLHRRRVLDVLRGLATGAVPVAIAIFAETNDPARHLCTVADCVALMVCIGFVRFWAVSKDTERFLLEREIAQRSAHEAAEAARKAQEAERVLAAAAALEARAALEAKKAAEQPRHTTPSFLHGGAKSPRFPNKPKP